MSFKRLRFSSDDDLALLRDIVAHNPLQNPEKWKDVQQNIEQCCRKKFSCRTLKDHVQLLISTWVKKNKEDCVRSGVEEIYSEKDLLLQEIADICKELNITNKKKVISKEKKIVQLGREAREQNAIDLFNIQENLVQNINGIYSNIEIEHNYNENMPDLCGLDSLCEDSFSAITDNGPEEISLKTTRTFGDNVTNQIEVIHTPITPIRNNTIKEPATKSPDNRRKVLGAVRRRNNKSTTVRRNAFEFLNNKSVRENEIKVKELQLEERRLEIEERKLKIQEKRLQMDLQEQENRTSLLMEKMKYENDERLQMSQLIGSQQNIIDTLIKALAKNEK